MQPREELAFVAVVSYNTMLKSCLKGGRVDEASELLKGIAYRGLPANSITYNDLPNARVQTEDRRGMWRLIEQMQACRARSNHQIPPAERASRRHRSCHSA